MPNPVGPAAQTQAIWTYVYNVLNAEIAPGKRLAGIADIRKSIHFWTQQAPVLGVQPHGWRKIGDYGQRRREIEVTFLISVGVFVTATPTRPANLDDALAALQPFLDDGNGNGVEPIIHTPANLTLGGLSVKTDLSECQYDWQIRADADQRTWAYGVYKLTAETIVTV